MRERGLSALETAVVVLIVLVLAALIMPALAPTRGGSRKSDCKNSLKQIGVYITLYESKYKSYPDMSDSRWLGMLWNPAMACDGNLFRCAVRGKAGSGTHFRVLKTPLSYPMSDGSYVWIPERPTDKSPSDLPLLADEARNHSDNDINVLFFQGRVDVFDLGHDRVKQVDQIFVPSGWAAPAGTK